jgi:DNA-binding NarL/FixJ family response regulator
VTTVPRIRVLIADDQALFREGLRTLLSTRPEVDVIAEAANGLEALAMAAQLQPAVVLMDLQMPEMDGIQATARMRDRHPDIPVLVLTTFDDDANLFGALRAGAAGYLLKDVSSDTLVAALQAATRGESFLQSTVTGRVVAAFARLMEEGGVRADALVLPLSPREREILGLLGTGASNKEIADRLNLAEGTVKNHVTNILSKLDVRDRTQAALRARQLGLVEPVRPEPTAAAQRSRRSPRSRRKRPLVWFVIFVTIGCFVPAAVGPSQSSLVRRLSSSLSSRPRPWARR